MLKLCWIHLKFIKTSKNILRKYVEIRNMMPSAKDLQKGRKAAGMTPSALCMKKHQSMEHRNGGESIPVDLCVRYGLYYKEQI